MAFRIADPISFAGQNHLTLYEIFYYWLTRGTPPMLP